MNSLAEVRNIAPTSIIVPTYHEAKNIGPLLDRIDRLRRDYLMELEVLLMDDQSNDGSVEAVEASGFDWAKIVVREGEKGLSAAVVDGLALSKYPVIIVMDADLSHPPEAIPSMILALESGQEFVIGSRYVSGGSTDDKWGFFRWLNSWIATLLARPLTNAQDPMSGFFALHRSTLEKAATLNPIGYKIGLELIVKCGIGNVGEVPIHFSDRQFGESKLSFKEQLRYIQHLRRLYIYKFAYTSSLLQFLVVGLSGVFVNLTVLTALVWTGLPNSISVAGGIAVSVVTNFLLNRRFTFSYARQGPIFRQFLGFCGASAAAMIVNYSVTMYASLQLVDTPIQVAALIGIATGTIINYTVNQFLVFRRRMNQD